MKRFLIILTISITVIIIMLFNNQVISFSNGLKARNNDKAQTIEETIKISKDIEKINYSKNLGAGDYYSIYIFTKNNGIMKYEISENGLQALKTTLSMTNISFNEITVIHPAIAFGTTLFCALIIIGFPRKKKPKIEEKDEKQQINIIDKQEQNQLFN